jgi:hypothetical protein
VTKAHTTKSSKEASSIYRPSSAGTRSACASESYSRRSRSRASCRTRSIAGGLLESGGGRRLLVRRTTGKVAERVTSYEVGVHGQHGGASMFAGITGAGARWWSPANRCAFFNRPKRAVHPSASVPTTTSATACAPGSVRTSDGNRCNSTRWEPLCACQRGVSWGVSRLCRGMGLLWPSCVRFRETWRRAKSATRRDRNESRGRYAAKLSTDDERRGRARLSHRRASASGAARIRSDVPCECRDAVSARWSNECAGTHRDEVVKSAMKASTRRRRPQKW